MRPILQGLETELISSFVWCPLGWKTGQDRGETREKARRVEGMKRVRREEQLDNSIQVEKEHIRCNLSI